MKGLKLIGKGLFFKVYSNNDLNYVVFNKNDYIKEGMVFNWFPNSRYFTKIKEIDIGGYYFLKMKKYKKTKKNKRFIKLKVLYFLSGIKKNI